MAHHTCQQLADTRPSGDEFFTETWDRAFSGCLTIGPEHPGCTSVVGRFPAIRWDSISDCRSHSDLTAMTPLRTLGVRAKQLYRAPQQKNRPPALVIQVDESRVDHAQAQPDKGAQGAVESGIVDAATGDEHSAFGWWSGKCQGGAVSKLIHRLPDKGGADEELPRSAGLA